MSHAESPHQMFYDSSFKGDLSQWDVSNVTDMSGLFWRSAFNGDISRWNVSKVETMDFMFTASAFRGDISLWNPTGLLMAREMFFDASFDQPLLAWDDKLPSRCVLTNMFLGSYWAKYLDLTNPTWEELKNQLDKTTPRHTTCFLSIPPSSNPSMNPSNELNDFKPLPTTPLAGRLLYDALQRHTHRFWQAHDLPLSREQWVEEGVYLLYVDFFIVLQNCKIIGPQADLYDSYQREKCWLHLKEIKQDVTQRAHSLRLTYHHIQPDPALQHSYLHYFQTLRGGAKLFYSEDFHLNEGPLPP